MMASPNFGGLRLTTSWLQPQPPEGQAAGLELLEDERKFIDLSRSPLFFGEEKEIFA
jgi:hypothetical protein